MIYSDTPAIDGGETWAHIFVGLILRITDVFKVKGGSAEFFLGALQDRVRKRGDPTKLIADDTPFTEVGRSPSIFAIPIPVSGNVKPSINIRILPKIVISSSNA